MPYAYNSIIFHGHPVDSDAVVHPWSGDIIGQKHFIPNNACQATFSKIDLSFGISIFQVKHRFDEHTCGAIVDLAEVESDLAGGAFMVQTVDRGRIWHKESYPDAEIEFAPGTDLFRFADRTKVMPRVDAAQDCVMTAMTISYSSMAHLLGGDLAERLLQALDLLPPPRVIVRSMPAAVSGLLHGIIPTEVTGALRRLFCHSRVLEYLSALIAHLGCDVADESRTATSSKRARKIFDMLLQTPGKLPSLDEIAKQFGASPRTLTAEFKAEYGQPIHAFMTDLRLNLAHAEIQGTTIPLKALAQQLGYTHTHHFLTAFRRKFGYPPSALRNKDRRAGV